MADPVGKLDIQVGFDLDEGSLVKIAKKMQKLSDKLLAHKNLNLGEELHTDFSKGLKGLLKEYKSFLKNIKTAYGVTNAQAKELAKQSLGKNGFAIRFLEKGEEKTKPSKNWTLQQLASKSNKYELLKKEYQEEGYTGSSLTKKLNKEFGRNYSQSYEKAKNTKAFKLLKEETKLKQKGLPFLKELGNLKGFTKGIFGVGFAGGVATLAGQAVSSYVGGQISKVEDYGAYGTADLSAMKKSMKVIGGDGWSGEAIEKALTSSFGYMTGKTQNIQTLGSDLAQMGIATGGRGSKYLTEYSNLIAEGYSDGTPKFREIMELSDKISRDKNLTKTDQKVLISKMTGSSEIAEKLMTNTDIGKYNLVDLNKEYYLNALAGISKGKRYKELGQDFRKNLIDIETNMNLNSELEKIVQKADQKASEEFGFWGSIWNRGDFLKRRDQLVKNEIDEKSRLIPALQETYKKNALSYGITPIVNINNNFNVSNDYDTERAGNKITDIIDVNLKNSQEFD